MMASTIISRAGRTVRKSLRHGFLLQTQFIISPPKGQRAGFQYLNPGFSKKDRIARQIIEDAEAEGLLAPGQTIVELTSGNTGTGLAIVCGIKGYHFVAVMSRGNSMERARMMSALGAEVVLVDQLPGSIPGQVSGGDLALVEEAAQRITTERARSGPISSASPATSAHTTCTPGRSSSASPAAGSMPSVTSRGRAARSPDAPRRSRSTTPVSSATSSSRKAPLCWQVSRPRIPAIGFKAAGMPCPICHCSGPSISMAT